MLALSALGLVRCEAMPLDSMKDIAENWPFQVLGQCTGTLHPGWGEAVLVGCPPLTQKMEVNSSNVIFLESPGVGAAFHPAGPQHERKPHGRLEKLTLCHSKACSGDDQAIILHGLQQDQTFRVTRRGRVPTWMCWSPKRSNWKISTRHSLTSAVQETKT